MICSPPGELLFGGVMVRRAVLDDLDAIEDIYRDAREYMRENGNPTQWGDSYPERGMLLDDIAEGNLYLIVRSSVIAGVFYFAVIDDATYRWIEGSWSSDEPYGVIHRIAARRGEHGIFSEALSFAFSRIGYIRIDTHRANATMRSLILSHGFSERGIIHTYDGSERIAFDVASV